MGVNVPGQVNYSLFLNGLEYPVTADSGLQILQNENCKMQLPTVKIVIDDIMRSMGTTSPVVDGTIIELQVGDGRDNPQTARFRAFGKPQRQESPTNRDVKQYSIVGILDCMEWVSARPGQPFTGTSVDVMRQIAQKLNLNIQTDLNTNDKMTWLPGRKTWGNYARDVISQFAWIDDKAAITHAIGADRALHFINITDRFSTAKPKAYLFHKMPFKQTSNNLLVLQWVAQNRSGMLNSWMGYGQRTTQMGYDGSPVQASAVQATTANNVLDINSDVAKLVGQNSRMVFTAADCSNTHPNWARAQHQNNRLKKTYSQNVYVMLFQNSGLQMFDLVEFSAADNGQPDKDVSGLYVITAISRTVINNRYYEKLELCNAGPGPDTAPVNTSSADVGTLSVLNSLGQLASIPDALTTQINDLSKQISTLTSLRDQFRNNGNV